MTSARGPNLTGQAQKALARADEAVGSVDVGSSGAAEFYRLQIGRGTAPPRQSHPKSQSRQTTGDGRPAMVLGVVFWSSVG